MADEGFVAASGAEPPRSASPHEVTRPFACRAAKAEFWCAPAAATATTSAPEAGLVTLDGAAPLTVRSGERKDGRTMLRMRGVRTGSVDDVEEDARATERVGRRLVVL